jgi:hypothetical protein
MNLQLRDNIGQACDTEKLIWRGASSDTLSDNAAKNTKNLDKGVNKMFPHFPPAPSTKN